MTSSGPVSPGTLLTVVVPVYNLESCVANALHSVLQQRYLDEITVLVVDDGSTDGSRSRIDEIVRNNPHADIRVITQPNGGVSAARNTGIAQASSPYLAFLDADDTWEPDFAEKIIPILREGRVDIVEYNIWIVGRNGKQSDELTMIGADLLDERPVDDTLLLDFASTYETFVWARVYRRELWHGIQFPPNQLYEDAAIIPLVYLRARTGYRLRERLYNYYRRAGSITQVMTPRSVRDLAKNVENALPRCSDPQHGRFWMVLSGKGFAHACRETARVDAAAFGEALRIVDSLARHCKAVAATFPELSEYVPFTRFRGAIYKERTVFLAKRFVKRVIRHDRRIARSSTGAAANGSVPALQDDH